MRSSCGRAAVNLRVVTSGVGSAERIIPDVRVGIQALAVQHIADDRIDIEEAAIFATRRADS